MTNSQKYNYRIFQLSADSDNDKRWESLPDDIDTVNMAEEKYTKVYENEIEGANEHEALENLFFIFNVQHPKDFRGHSLSVSDIVSLNDIYFFCQSNGWKIINAVC